MILQYVKDNELQNKEERKYINLDDKLTCLLNPVPGEKTSYFNIQKLLKVHYTSLSNVTAIVKEEEVKEEPIKAKTKTKTKKPKN